MANGARSKARKHAAHRSPSAQRAHATGDVTWMLDLSQPVAVRHASIAAAAAKRQLAGLGLVAVGVWGYNIGMVLTHLHK